MDIVAHHPETELNSNSTYTAARSAKRSLDLDEREIAREKETKVDSLTLLVTKTLVTLHKHAINIVRSIEE